MHSFLKNAVLFLAIMTGILFMVAIGGCQSSAEANRVDPTLARSTLETVMESWKQGESIQLWQKNDSPVVVQDLDWTAGIKLTSFEILDQGDAVDANLFCRVKLSLEDKDANRFDREVTYVVGTSPVRTVFRSLTP